MRYLVILGISLGVHAEAVGGGLPLVEDHQGRGVIVIPDGATDQNRAAAGLLAEYVTTSSGATLKVVAESKVDGEGSRVHVGMTRFAEQAGLPLSGLDDDGFVIEPVDGRNLVIVGPTDWGTEFGVCEFLERSIGVRWLLPGKHGTHVPKRADIAGPAERVREEPVNVSRLMSGLRGGVQAKWARRNRMHGRISFHHNLLRLFPPETYTKTHPEFFPIHKGKRYLPSGNEVHGWQPCFSAEGIVAEAVKNIKAYFAAHPEATSYSLGVNDSAGHCECEACQAKDTGENNFVGVRDVSDRYFAWCNAVVTEVLKAYPDKLFGCLAYRQVVQAPSRVKIHERIIPYLTYDRMKWADPALRKQGHEITESWQRVSSMLGWYEYLYGTPYLLPRVYFHQMAENYRYAQGHGVRAHYAEAYPNWGEGPKLYLALKLQWNPDQDVDALLRDWYVACVGEAAAKDLAGYYQMWERFWTETAPKTPWFTPKGEYLRFSSPDYLQAVAPEMIARSRELLEATVAKTTTADQRARAALLLRAFEYYEASALAYLDSSIARTRSPNTEADVLAILAAAPQAIRTSVKRLELVKTFADHAVLVHPLPPTRYASLHSISSWGLGTLWSVQPWLEKSEPVRQRVEALSRSDYPAVAREARMMLAIADGEKNRVSTNPGFEKGEGVSAADWSFWVKSTGRLRRTDEVKRTGRFSVAADDFSRGGPVQVIPVTPGRYFGQCYVYVSPDQDSIGTVELAVTMRDGTGQNLDEAKSRVRPVPGQWTPIITILDVTAQSRGKDVTHVLFCPIVNGYREGQRVFVDDCELFRVME